MATGGEGRKGLDDEGTINVASKKVTKDRPNGVIKLKKPIPKQIKPGNWREGSVVNDDKKSKATEHPSIIGSLSPGPVVNQLDDSARDTFATGRPLEDNLNLQQCKHCKKGIIKTAAKEHIAQCLRIKKEKAQRKKEAREARERAKEQAREEEARKNDEDGDAKMNDDSDDDDDGSLKKGTGGKASKKVGGKKPDGEPKGKKRKADGDADKGPKSKKKKEEPKPKVPKPKGPVDVEKQCGVILPNGQPCARSLTCKSHSMGAKRAVAGRSLPYDMLLAAYQKKNQAKQQKAALDANAPLEDDDDANAGPVDSDEETAAVMGALARWNPQPVVPQPIFAPIKRTYQLARLHEQLQTATNGGRTNIFKVVGLGAQRLPENHAANHTTMNMDMDDAPGEPDLGMMGSLGVRRSSSISMQANSRRPSVIGRA
ncbi:SCA7, zinc-binding domain-containing protein [Annulohypoxylon truncatum]|uniref:SCA7, zinc-binding domain-containing protein n=1 Tax=Annulohypoxylon truncatum TaxID=327061 RepID=UPI002007AA17|nr:SCA7, zinc-binding domain-containing protein [Annulohypoxylon truncatum]KAI1212194.1 SCA7, zinc-binding domain-containing protein [Annulohypoxylon truncatum]